MSSETPRVSVVGSGYVGTVVAACFASLGHRVVGVEVDPKKLADLSAGICPFFESGLEDLLGMGLRSGRLRFTSDYADAMDASDVVFLCLGTPSLPDGRADMRAMEAAARSIAANLAHHHVLVTKSTVPIGSGNWLASVIEDALPSGVEPERLFSVVSNPEFLREGSAINDFLYPDRVVLGSDDPTAIETVAALYRPILEQSFANGRPDLHPPLVRTKLTTAETVKYASNAFLATKISFVNEIANICELVGADITEVTTAMGLDERIGPLFLNAGVGWGGSCFGKDLASLVSSAEEYGYRADLLQAVIDVNDAQRRLVIDKLQSHLKTLRGQRIALLGLAFKPGTDDLRDAPAVDLAQRLVMLNAVVSAHDPVVQQAPKIDGYLRLASSPYEAAERADAVVLLTEWPEYLALDLDKLADKMRGNLFLDGRNLFNPEELTAKGFHYEGIGRVQTRRGAVIRS